jgi:4,5-DOPA dioxygenase extradiol
MAATLPAIFFGHGNPLNALASNNYTEAWREIGQSIPRPSAILMMSAHWYGTGTAVTAGPAPRTIHDFSGFPPELSRVNYAAPGDDALARRVQQMLSPDTVALSTGWGLDHGAWSVLLHAYPAANIPVVQISIDATQPPRFHYELGRRLGPLRDEGILLAGSGNLVHNLRSYAWGRPETPAFDWAARFEEHARRLIDAHQHETLIDFPALGDDAHRAIPSPDHYLPLLFVLGARRAAEPVSYPAQGFEGGALSMLSVRIG